MPTRSSNNTQPKKRSRAKTEDEEDASSPVTVRGSHKKQRLAEPTDEVSVEESPAVKPSRTSGRRIQPPKKKLQPTAEDDETAKAYEVPDSEDEGDDDDDAPLIPTKKAPVRKARAAPARSSKKTNVYEVPDSGDEISGATTPQRQQSPVKRGRRKKQDDDDNDEVQDGIVSAGSAAPNGHGSGRKRGGTKAAAQVETEPEEEEEEGEEGAEEEVEISKEPAKARRGGARGGKRGGRGGKTSVPRGILSPQKKKAPAPRGARKSVAFSGEQEDEGEEVTFPDLPSKAKTSSGKRTRKQDPEPAAEVEAEEEEPDAEIEAEDDAESGSGSEEDDEVCAICLNPDSEEGNEIVFCDNCDNGYHQECHGLAAIPEGDWICRNCSQDSGSSKNKTKTKSPSTGTATTSAAKDDGSAFAEPAIVAREENEKPDIPNFEEHLRSMQRVLLDRCTGRRRIKLIGQDEAYEKAHQLVEQTVVAGEGNSMMVIGARGCGKTTLVESIVADVAKYHQDQFHVVRLNGFIHTDDKLALREIWRQLGKEMEVEDELISKTNNYADTLASLLALLSHPTEMGVAAHDDGVTSRSVIFVIDEFDLFATHARQTLLYNLFDIAQARKAPIAVLGLTTRIDVVESLEKRVKSRFSHRYVYLSLPKSLPAYWEICKQGLLVDDQDMKAEGIDNLLKGHTAFWRWWAEKIDTLHKTPTFQSHLGSHYYSTKSVSAFLTSCILPLSSLTPTSLSLRIPGGFFNSLAPISLDPPASKLHLLESLSDLDLAMLIAAARLDIVAHTDTVNFAMAYDEYTSLMSRQRVQSASAGMLVALGGGVRVWGRGIAGIAWERLVTLGLLVPAGAATGGRAAVSVQQGGGSGGLDNKMWKVDVALEEIPAAPGVRLNAVLGRWCKEI